MEPKPKSDNWVEKNDIFSVGSQLDLHGWQITYWLGILILQEYSKT